MSIGLKGKNLIFVISQPRAGSTMLQRMLGGHPEIHTTSEPWLMLHPFYALRAEGYEAEYSARTARLALSELLGTLPGGEAEYVEGVRRMYAHLYDRALSNSGKRYFLDKTPRYYLIIQELYRTFPEANFIILMRNPLAMLGSVLNLWIEGHWSTLRNFKNDLVRAPRLLIEGTKLLGDNHVVVQYEKLVAHPADETQRICRALGADWRPEIIEYNSGHEIPHWRLGDQESVYRHARPVAENAQKWVGALADPQFWRLTNDYLERLGRETVAELGYDFDELRQTLEMHRPGRARLLPTLSLEWFMEKPRRWQRGVARITHSLRQRRGASGPS